MRILVAEDDQVIADFVSQGLREAGYAVDVAATGPDALKKALEGGYDVSSEGTSFEPTPLVLDRVDAG